MFHKLENVNIDQTITVYYSSKPLKIGKFKVEDSNVLPFDTIFRIFLGFNCWRKRGYNQQKERITREQKNILNAYARYLFFVYGLHLFFVDISGRRRETFDKRTFDNFLHKVPEKNSSRSNFDCP